MKKVTNVSKGGMSVMQVLHEVYEGAAECPESCAGVSQGGGGKLGGQGTLDIQKQVMTMVV